MTFIKTAQLSVFPLTMASLLACREVTFIATGMLLLSQLDCMICLLIICIPLKKLIGCNLPRLQELFVSRTRRRAAGIPADPPHPGHKLFHTVPSGKRLRSIRTRTSLHQNCFFPSAVSLLNRDPTPPADTPHSPPTHNLFF